MLEVTLAGTPLRFGRGADGFEEGGSEGMSCQASSSLVPVRAGGWKAAALADSVERDVGAGSNAEACADNRELLAIAFACEDADTLDCRGRRVSSCEKRHLLPACIVPIEGSIDKVCPAWAVLMGPVERSCSLVPASCTNVELAGSCLVGCGSTKRQRLDDVENVAVESAVSLPSRAGAVQGPTSSNHSGSASLATCHLRSAACRRPSGEREREWSRTSKKKLAKRVQKFPFPQAWARRKAKFLRLRLSSNSIPTYPLLLPSPSPHPLVTHRSSTNLSAIVGRQRLIVHPLSSIPKAKDTSRSNRLQNCSTGTSSTSIHGSTCI